MRLWQFLLLLYVGLLFVAAVIEPLQAARDLGSPRVHAGAFLLAAVLAFLALRRWRDRLLGLLGLFLFGIAIELVQTLLPWRSGRLVDLVYNLAGLLLGALLAGVLEALLARFGRLSRQRGLRR